MKHAFMGRCAPDFGLWPVTSLNEPAKDFDADSDSHQTEIVDTIIDPDTELDGGLYGAERDQFQEQVSLHLRRFILTLSPHLRCIALRHFWIGQSQVSIASDLGVTRSAIPVLGAALRELDSKEMKARRLKLQTS